MYNYQLFHFAWGLPPVTVRGDLEQCFWWDGCTIPATAVTVDNNGWNLNVDYLVLMNEAQYIFEHKFH